MRILHITPYMHPSAGGPPVVVENFARETRRLGHEVQIVSTSRFCDGDQTLLLDHLNKIAPTIFIPDAGIFASFNIRGRGQMSACIQDSDIVHLHTLWNPINMMVRQECHRHDRPYVLMPHGMLDPYSLSVRRIKKAFYLWAIERRNIINAQRLIFTTSEEGRLAAARFSQVIWKEAIIPLGADAPNENREALASRFVAKFPKVRNRRQLLFLGRLHYKKGLDRVLKVLPSIAEVFPDVLLTVAGDGSAEFESKLKEAILDKGLQQHVLLTGRLDGDSKWEAYASAELFLLPSRQENFALTVVEAMQMGVPVVIGNKVNTWPYVEEAGAGLVLDDRTIVPKLREGILSMLKDGPVLKRMGKCGREYARKYLTWTRATATLMECYNEVLHCQPVPQPL